MKLLLKLSVLFALGLCVGAASATTFYIRADGGTRYSSPSGGGNTGHGMCNGTTDASYTSVGGTTNMTWLASYTYAPGAQIVDIDGNYESTSGGGVSGASYWPTWGSTTTDNTISWTRGSAAPQNQNCAYDDYRFLYDDQRYNPIPGPGWAISGGDTVVVRGCFNVNENGDGSTACRIGASPPARVDYWCVGVSGADQGCSSGPIPAGTSGAHTRILGQCVLAGNCNSGNVTINANLTQLFGGSGLGTAINLEGTQYVDFWGIEVTRHSQCIGTGLPAYPAHCGGGDDYVAEGIFTNISTENLSLQDVWVHGMTDTGIRGPFNGNLTANRVNVSYNGQSGWDFDDGASSPTGTTAAFTFTYSQIEWNGCNQEYPITHTYPAISCYGQSNQGYGDGMGTAPGYCFNVTIDNAIFDHNTQDGIDFGHFNTVNRTDGQCLMSITNSLSYANGGAAWKWGPAPTAVIFTDNTGIANCNRMSAPITGAPSTYNANLGDFCRAGDGFTWAFFDHSTLQMMNNTFINYAPTTFDVLCEDPSTCADGSWTFENNIILGYANLPFTDYGGNGLPAVFCGPGCNSSTAAWPPMTRGYNDYYGSRGVTCPTGSTGEICTNPLLYNQATLNGSSFVESELDYITATGYPGFYLASTGSPPYQAGTTGGPANFSTQLGGASQTSPATMGAGPVFSGTPTAATPTFFPVGGIYGTAQSVAISAATGPVICWSTAGAPATDGTTGCTTGSLYTAPVTVSVSETLYAIAGGTGYVDSSVGSAIYIITGGGGGGTVISGAIIVGGKVQ